MSLFLSGRPWISDQRGRGGEVAQLLLPVRAHEGQPTGLWDQPQGIPGQSAGEPTTAQGI